MAVGFCVGIEDIRKSAPRPAISSRRWCCCHMSDGTNTRSIGGDVVSRRSFLSLSTLAVVGTVLVSPGCARGRETSVGENSLAERVTMTEGVRPQEKVMAPDIYYPEWMGGVWNSESVLTSVTAPFGETVFGRPGAFEAAKKEIGRGLKYDVRFRRLGGRVISDRAYNVITLSKAAMGDDCVLQVTSTDEDPNQIQIDLLPKEAGGVIFKVHMRVIGRCIDPIQDERTFCCSEFIRQSVVPQMTDRPPLAKIKDVDTVTCYYLQDDGTILAKQRTAMYFQRGDPKATAIQNRAIDIRTYDINYSLTKKL